MKKIILLPLLFVGALSSLASAQDSAEPLFADLAGTRLTALGQETGGQVAEEWYTPKLRASLSILGRVSFPSSTEVTIDGLWYSDFFDVGWGVAGELDLLSFVTPHWAVGGYLSVNFDQFSGETLHFFNGDFVNVDNMDLVSVIVGGKVVQRISPYAWWEGHLGVGWVHYDAVNWSGVDQGVPFSDEQLFKPINRAVFEFAGRFLFGDKHVQGFFGFGLRYMGGAARGADVSNFIDPDVFITFMLELGLTVRF